MVSTPSDWVKANGSSPSHSSFSLKSQSEPPVEIDTEQTYRLIDSILPFEACLYHQILPLSLEGSRLRLGVVNPDDSTALDYVRRILAYMNCSLVPQVIASDAHRSLLSAYLSQAGKKKSSPSEKLPETSSKASSAGGNSADSQPRRDPSPPVLDRNTQPTLVVDSPEELSGFLEADVVPIVPAATASTPAAAAEADLDATQQTFYQQDWEEPAHPPAVEASSTLLLSPDERVDAPPSPETLPSFDGLPTLDIEAMHLSDPVEVLATLSPNKLLHELLGRVLVGGIGRLYFERQQRQGRILWSQNGVLQSVLENLDLSLIQGVINELKLLTHLPLISVQQAKQVEIERIYQNSRLLLRLRVMPGTHGEEATLQVLRGAALKFYQQQQLANLGRDALTIAQQLQNKVSEIRSRARFDASLPAEQLDIIPALHQLLRSVDQQLEALQHLQATNRNEDGQ